MKRLLLAAAGVALGVVAARELKKRGFAMPDIRGRLRSRPALRLARAAAARFGLSEPEASNEDSTVYCAGGALCEAPVELYVVSVGSRLYCELNVYVTCVALAGLSVSLGPRPAGGAAAYLGIVAAADHARFDVHHVVFIDTDRPRPLPSLPAKLLDFVADHPDLTVTEDQIHLARTEVTSVDEIACVWQATQTILVAGRAAGLFATRSD